VFAGAAYVFSVQSMTQQEKNIIWLPSVVTAIVGVDPVVYFMVANCRSNSNYFCN